MARKNFETFDISSNGDNGTQYESIPYGYTMSPTCPPDSEAFQNDGVTFPPSEDAFGGFGAFNRKEFGGADVGASYTPTVGVASEDEGKTIIDDMVGGEEDKIRPVVGWLVGTKGLAMGKDFRLHGERNYIGRKEGLDVVLADKKVSRDPAVQVVYDARSNNFFVAACDGTKIISYLNGDLLLQPRVLKAYDRIQLGDSELLFIPLCGPEFTWEENK